jgi:hypothetical protein
MQAMHFFVFALPLLCQAAVVAGVAPQLLRTDDILFPYQTPNSPDTLATLEGMHLICQLAMLLHFLRIYTRLLRFLLLAGTVGAHILHSGFVQSRLVFDKRGIAPVVLQAPGSVASDSCGDSSELHQLTGSKIQVTGTPCSPAPGEHSLLQHFCVTRIKCIDRAAEQEVAGVPASAASNGLSKHASRRLKQAARAPPLLGWVSNGPSKLCIIGSDNRCQCLLSSRGSHAI